MSTKYDAAAFVCPSCHPDPRMRTFRSMGLGEWEMSMNVLGIARKAAAVLFAAAVVFPASFHVDAFGAKPDGNTDCAPAVYKAVAAAAANNGAVIEFCAGIYQVMPPDTNQIAALDFSGIANITFRGKGTNTVIRVARPPYGGFRFSRCMNIAVEDIAVDHDIVPFTQGTISAADAAAGTFDLAVDEGYPAPDAPFFADAKSSFGVKVIDGVFYDLIVHRMKSVMAMGAPVFRFTVKDHAALTKAGLAAGDRYAHSYRWYVQSAIGAWDCTNISVRDVAIYACPATTTTWANTKDVAIRGMTVMRRPGSGRIMSSCADGIHSFGVRGTFLIERCHFEGMLDDSINIHCRAATVWSNISPTRFTVNNAGTFRCYPGDRIQIFDPAVGRIRAETTVVAVDAQHPYLHTITVASPVEGLVAGRSTREADNVYNLDASGGQVIIRSNFFGRHRGRSILVKSDAIITDNVFENIDGLAIAVIKESEYSEGPVPHDIRIERNVFRGVHGLGANAQPSIRSMISSVKGMSLHRDIRNIVIAGNTYADPRVGGIDIRNASGVSIVSNMFSMNAGGHPFPLPTVLLMQSSLVRIESLFVYDMSSNAAAAVRIHSTVDAGDAGVIIRGLNVRLPEGVAPVDDGRAVK
ncbi:MAG: right-handed parallel beta-helix repeat-containing protein [Spirochaetota bacterium]